MPLYSFSRLNGDGYVVVRQFPLNEVPRTILDDAGETLQRDVIADMRTQGRQSRSGWPIHCQASSVLPDQAQELRDHLRKSGVPTEVDSNGRPIYTSQRHQREALKARNMRNNDDYIR